MLENKNQKNSEYGHFSRSASSGKFLSQRLAALKNDESLLNTLDSL